VSPPGICRKNYRRFTQHRDPQIPMELHTRHTSPHFHDVRILWVTPTRIRVPPVSQLTQATVMYLVQLLSGFSTITHSFSINCQQFTIVTIHHHHARSATASTIKFNCKQAWSQLNASNVTRTQSAKATISWASIGCLAMPLVCSDHTQIHQLLQNPRS